MHPLQSLVASLILSLVSTLFFFRTGGVLSHLNSLTHRFPRFPPRKLCSLTTLAVFSLVFAATDIAFCWALIFLGLAESRILPAAPADTRTRIPLISFCTVQLCTLCAAHPLATLYLSTISGPDPGELADTGAPWSSAMSSSLGRGSGNQQQQHIVSISVSNKITALIIVCCYVKCVLQKWLLSKGNPTTVTLRVESKGTN